MNTLDVPGASLRYEVVGDGPLLVLIPGANGDHAIYQPLAHAFADQYCVLTYDRRGFSESVLTGAQDYEHRLERDAADVQQLIAALSDEPALVFGSSSGAIVALHVLLRHPDVVRRLFVHEPPLVKLLPDGEPWVQRGQQVYDLYQATGPVTAQQQFVEQVVAPVDRRAMSMAPDANQGPFRIANATYWFEREVRQYPTIDLDLEAVRAYNDRIVVLVGQEGQGAMPTQTASILAERLGLAVTSVPGAHVGYITHVAAFAAAFRAMLAASV